MSQVHWENGTTGLARLCHGLVLGNNNVCFRVLARGTEDKLVDESIEEALEFLSVMGSIDNVAVCRDVSFGLGPQLTAKVLCGVHWRPGEGLGNVGHVDNHRLDPVAFAFNLGD